MDSSPRRIPVGLSTSSVYPLGVPDAFRLAAEIGYDGLEVLVWSSPISQNTDALQDLVQVHQLPILAVHAPTLLVTQRVWGKEAWAKITGACAMAQRLGVATIVAHPPFRWQRGYAEGFVDGVAKIAADTGIQIAVENMYPWRVGGRELPAYLPDYDPSDEDYSDITWDLSHAATANADSLGTVRRLLAEGRMRHLHLADGSGSTMKDEHLAPGLGVQPCAGVLAALAGGGFDGAVVLELNTRRMKAPGRREQVLRYSLDYAHEHLGQAAATSSQSHGA